MIRPLACPGDATWSPHLRAISKQNLNVVDDMECDALCNWRFREPRSLSPIVWMVTRSKSRGSSTVRAVGPKAFEPWSESRLRNDLWYAFSATGAGVIP